MKKLTPHLSTAKRRFVTKGAGFTLSGYTPLDTPLDRNTKSYLTWYTEVGRMSQAEDYEQKEDKKQEAVRVALKYRF